MKVNKLSHFITRTITAFFLSLFFLFIFFFLPPIILSCILICILIYVLLLEWPQLFKKNPSYGFLLAPLYPIAPLLLLVYLNQHFLYHALLFPLVAITASFDIGAYVVGSLFGNHKILPSISPGKSWEGLLGGFICSLIACTTYNWFIGKPLLIKQLVVICSLICLCAFLGDLFESWLKRRAKIKDIGTVLPGHGGFLDRLDGILFVSVFFYVFRNYLIMFF